MKILKNAGKSKILATWPSVETNTGAQMAMEKVGRVCYQSERRPITAESADGFLESVKNRTHYSVLEHGWRGYFIKSRNWSYNDIIALFWPISKYMYITYRKGQDLVDPGMILISANLETWRKVHKRGMLVDQAFNGIRHDLGEFCPTVFPKVKFDNSTDLHIEPINSVNDLQTSEEQLNHIAHTTVYDDCSRGFCYDNKTEVLTLEGWKLFKDTTDLDEFFTLNPKSMKSEYQKRISYTEAEWEGELIGMKNTRIDFLVTPNHRLLWYHSDSRISKEWKIDLAERVYGKRCKFSRALFSKWIGIPVNQEFSQSDSLVFAKFLGIFATDGTLYKNKDSGGRVILTQTKPEGRSQIKEILNDLCWKYKEEDAGFRINNTKLYNFCLYFRQGQLKKNSRIPSWLKMAPHDYISAFLEGAMIGDGTIHSSNGHRVLYCASKNLAGDYQDLFLKIGLSGIVRIDGRKKERKFKKNYGRDIGKKFTLVPSDISYNVSITDQGFPLCGRKKTKQTQWYKKKYKGKVFCVTVPNGIIYVRRNGFPVWLGNTHELVRHRPPVFSQESTRYVDESEFTVVVPPHKDEHEVILKDFCIGDRCESGENIELVSWFELNENMYRALRKAGWRPEDARQILPTAIKAQIAMSCNLLERRYIYYRRTSIYAHWEIRKVMCDELRHFQALYPDLLNMFEYVDEKSKDNVQGFCRITVEPSYFCD